MAGVDDLALQLQAVSARLKEIGEDGLARSLSTAIGKAVRPLPGEIRDGMRSYMPNAYAAVLAADTKISRRTTQTEDGTKVTVYATNASFRQRRLSRLDSGILWHPVFGNRKEWREQGAPSVTPGWFSDPAEKSAPDIRAAITEALDEVVRKAVGE
jgi:hypothetical protein